MTKPLLFTTIYAAAWPSPARQASIWRTNSSLWVPFMTFLCSLVAIPVFKSFMGKLICVHISVSHNATLSSGNGQCDYSKFDHSPSRRDFHVRTMIMTNITIFSMKYSVENFWEERVAVVVVCIGLFGTRARDLSSGLGLFYLSSSVKLSLSASCNTISRSSSGCSLDRPVTRKTYDLLWLAGDLFSC